MHRVKHYIYKIAITYILFITCDNVTIKQGVNTYSDMYPLGGMCTSIYRGRY